VISAQFAVEISFAAQNRLKIHKNFCFDVQLGAKQKPVYDFLLMIIGNLGAISHGF